MTTMIDLAVSEDEALAETTETEEKGGTVVYLSKDGRIFHVYADKTTEFEERVGEHLATEDEWNEFLGPEAWEVLDPDAKPQDDREELIANNEAIFAEELRQRLGTGALSGIFRRANKLVHTPREGEDGYVPPEDPRDDDGPAQVQVIDPESLAAVVDIGYRVVKMVEDKDATKKAGKPMMRPVKSLSPINAVKRAYAAGAMGMDTPNIRVLRSITHTPVLRWDGSVLNEPGYDDASKLLYLPTEGLVVPPIPDNPTMEQVKEAMGRLLWLIKDFPFVSEDHRANFVGGMFTPVMRPLVPPPYQFLFITAPSPGAGKGFLAEILGNLHGRVMRGSLPRDGDEFRKTITATLLTTTAPIVQFDNLRGVVHNADLEMMLTSQDWADRNLGRNEIKGLKNDRLWVATGNNARLSGDLERRTIIVEIDPQVPHPEKRKFAVNPPRYVAEHRGELLAAILTVARGWVVNGKQPYEPDTTDSFEVWRGTMRGMLHWAGVPGTFGAEQNQIAVVSEEDEDWATFFGAVHEVVGDRTFTTDMINALVRYDGVKWAREWFGEDKPKKGKDKAQIFDLDYHDPAIDPAVLPDPVLDRFRRFGSDHEANFKKSLGKFLGYKIKRWMSDYRLVQVQKGDKKNPSLWKIETKEP